MFLSRSPSCLPTFWAVVLIGLFSAPTPAVQAADIEKLDSSLKEIPADASFYISLMRNREQVEAVLKSKAWAKLMALPALQKAWQEGQTELAKPGEAFDRYQQWVKDPTNKELVEFLLEMVSDEVFIYGGSNVAEVGDLYGRAMSALLIEGLRAGMTASPTDQKAPKAPPVDDRVANRLMLREIARNPKALAVPEIMIGFKIANPERATTQIKRLEKIIQQGLEQGPHAEKFKDRLRWTKVANGNFLTLSFTSKDADFDEASIRKYEDKPGEFDAVVKRLKDFQVTLSLGVRGKYVLLTLGETTTTLARLGTGKRLIDQPELQPLTRFADQRLTAVSYYSKAFRSQTSAAFFDLRKWFTAGLEALPDTKLPAAVQTRIRKDLTAFLEERKASEPRQGSELSFAFLTERGKETYEYDWSEHPAEDGSKPLTILNHVGGDPLYLSASRSKYDPQAWPRFVRWVKVLYGYAEDYALPLAKPEEKKIYEESFKKVLVHLLLRIDEATAKMFLPALADGQSAFVVDAKLASKQWLKNMPELPKPLTLPEPAFIYGVSDAELLQKAMAEYRAVASAWLTEVAKTSPQPLPFKEVPKPQTRKIKDGTLFFYPLPEAWGVDPHVLPNAALSDKMAVLALSQEHSERLLAATPFKPIGKPLADVKRPLIAATQFNFAGLVDLLVSGGDSAAGLAPPDQRSAEAIKQARTIIELFKVFRGYSSARYREANATVTHGEWIFVDLK